MASGETGQQQAPLPNKKPMTGADLFKNMASRGAGQQQAGISNNKPLTGLDLMRSELKRKITLQV